MKRVVGALLAVTVGAGVTACGGAQGDPGAPPSQDTTSSTPSASQSAGVEPATGAKLRLGGLALRVPDGWKLAKMTDFAAAAHWRGGGAGPGVAGDGIGFGATSSFSRQSLDGLVRIARQGGSWTRRPERLPDVTVGGETLYHLVGPAAGGYHDDRYGAQVRGHDYSITFHLRSPQADRREIADSVLATVVWW